MSSEVYAVIRDELIHCRAAAGQFGHHEEEARSFAVAIVWARPDDLVRPPALAGFTLIQDQLTGVNRCRCKPDQPLNRARDFRATVQFQDRGRGNFDIAPCLAKCHPC